jgi:hypothetical protein
MILKNINLLIKIIKNYLNVALTEMVFVIMTKPKLSHFKIVLLLPFFSLLLFKAQAQMKEIRGSVFEKGKNLSENPVPNAKVLYSKTIFTFTDKKGEFQLEIPDSAKKISD